MDFEITVILFKQYRICSKSFQLQMIKNSKIPILAVLLYFSQALDTIEVDNSLYILFYGIRGIRDTFWKLFIHSKRVH